LRLHPNVVLPALTSLLGFGFAGVLLRRFARRPHVYHLVWALGLVWYALAAGSEALGGAQGWTPGLYRAWYITGAIGVAALMLLYPKLRGSQVVGSDLAHAIPLVTVAGLGHLQLGHIDYRLLVGLLLGSVPGIYIGSTVSSRLPDVMMRRILACILLVMGIACVVGG